MGQLGQAAKQAIYIVLLMIFSACAPVRFNEGEPSIYLCEAPTLSVESQSSLVGKFNLNDSVELKVISQESLLDIQWTLPDGTVVSDSDALTVKLERAGTQEVVVSAKSVACPNTGKSVVSLVVNDQCPNLTSMAISGPLVLALNVAGDFMISGVDRCLDLKSSDWYDQNNNKIGSGNLLNRAFNLAGLHTLIAKVTTESAKSHTMSHTVNVYDPSDYTWAINTQTQCSASQCGVQGSITRTFKCVDKQNVTVTSTLCNDATKPTASIACSNTCASCTVIEGGETRNVESGSTIDMYSAKTIDSPALCSSIKKARLCTDGKLDNQTSFQYLSCAEKLANSCTMPYKDAMAVIVTNPNSVQAYSTSAVAYGSSCASQSRTCGTTGALSGSYLYKFCSTCTQSQQLLVNDNGDNYCGVCSPNAPAQDTSSCGVDNNATITKTCNSTGTEWLCSHQCNEGYTYDANRKTCVMVCGANEMATPYINVDGDTDWQCLPIICSANAILSAEPDGCSDPLQGEGFRRCNVYGTGYVPSGTNFHTEAGYQPGYCLAKCNSGYYYDGSTGTCKSTSCTNGALNGPPAGNCTVCPSGQSLDIVTGACMQPICQAGSVNYNGCNPVPNGTNIKVCSSTGTSWSMCTLTCDGGYVKSANGQSCIKQ